MSATAKFEFNRIDSVFPVRVTPDSLISDFYIVIDYVVDTATTWFLGVTNDDVDYLLQTQMVTPEEEGVPTSGTLEVQWNDAITAHEFLVSLDESLPVTSTKYLFDWITGYMEDDMVGYVTDVYNSAFQLTAGEFSLTSAVLVGGFALALLGAVSVSERRGGRV